MDEEEPLFDVHLAECVAQAAAIWLVLGTITRWQLRSIPRTQRVEFLRLLASAEAITLPASEDPRQSDVPEWIARRYWHLLETFVRNVNDTDEFGLVPKEPF
jgi:hypothetical protein